VGGLINISRAPKVGLATPPKEKNTRTLDTSCSIKKKKLGMLTSWAQMCQGSAHRLERGRSRNSMTIVMGSCYLHSIPPNTEEYRQATTHMGWWFFPTSFGNALASSRFDAA